MTKDFIEVVKERRSVRRFLDKVPDDNLVKTILQLGLNAPTPCNQQLWRFVVIKDKGIKERLVNEAATSTMILRAPLVIAVMYDDWNYKESIQSSSMAVQNILLAATYFGLGPLAMNSFGAESKVKKILRIPDRYDICCFVCLGYPADIDAKASPVPRRNISEILDYNFFKLRDDTSYSYEPEKWELKHITEYQKYFCRKTFLGKEMDIFHPLEKRLVGITLSSESKVLDLLSYDGAYLPEIHAEKIMAVDLCKETSDYTKEAVKLNKKGNVNFEFVVYSPDKKSLSDSEVSAITLIYKAERVSLKILNKLMAQAYDTLQNDGRVIIISRRKCLMFLLFYKAIRILFGDDMRKTGIYAFFGPYKPINPGNVKRILGHNGFRRITEKRYFIFPPFFDQAYQMFLQYKKSEGSTYLHRIRRENLITRGISAILKFQGIRQSRFGTISVIEARK